MVSKIQNMIKKWKITFCINGVQKEELFYDTNFTDEEVKKYVKNKYKIKDDDIRCVSGAFESIKGKKMFVGTHAINSSLNLGCPYSKSGNAFFKLINPKLEEERAIIENSNNPEEIATAIEYIEGYFKNYGLGIADIIDFCNSSNSSDSNIALDEEIVWNDYLLDLIYDSDIVFLNGKARSRTKKCTYMFLIKYLAEHDAQINDEFIIIKNKKIKYVTLYSSSNRLQSKYHEKRKDEWNAFI